MSNRKKKYNLCPLCKDVELVKVPHTKYTWRCPACGYTIDPNWKHGKFNMIDRIQVLPELWAGVKD